MMKCTRPGKQRGSFTSDIVVLIIFLVMGSSMYAQTMYGTTGLLHAPTAEMQKDKTVLLGGSMIDHSIYRDSYWNAHDEYDPYTFNYYFNVTISLG